MKENEVNNLVLHVVCIMNFNSVAQPVVHQGICLYQLLVGGYRVQILQDTIMKLLPKPLHLVEYGTVLYYYFEYFDSKSALAFNKALMMYLN